MKIGHRRQALTGVFHSGLHLRNSRQCRVTIAPLGQPEFKNKIWYILNMRLKQLIILVAAMFTVSCGSQETSGSTNDTGDITSKPSSDTQELDTPLSSMEKPFKPGDVFDTKGWSDMRVELVGVASERVARIYIDDYDPSLDYVIATFSGTNKHGEKSSMYSTMWACEPSGAAGKSGTFRQAVIGSDYKNSQSGYQLLTTSDDEVLDGFSNSGSAIYPVDRGDTSAFILSQSEHCGSRFDLDLVVALGNVSLLPVIP